MMKKLARVSEYGRADARLFEPRILLHNGDVPAIELTKLGVTLLNDFLSTWDVEKAGNFLIDVPFPNRARQRHDVLACVVGDEEARRCFEFLRGFRDVTHSKCAIFPVSERLLVPSKRQP